MSYLILFHIVGFVAMSLMNASAIPQIRKIAKTKKVGDLTIKRELLLLCGCTLYLIYGIYRKDPVIITSNIWAMSMFLSLIYLIKKYGK